MMFVSLIRNQKYEKQQRAGGCRRLVMIHSVAQMMLYCGGIYLGLGHRSHW
jgi:hypothetical protein